MISKHLTIDYPERGEKPVLAVTSPNADKVVPDAVETWIDMATKAEHIALMVCRTEKIRRIILFNR